MGNDIALQEGQVLLEAWHVEFVGRPRMHRAPEEWVECRVVKMYHGTIYGGATGVGRTVEEARLNAVLGLANAICEDVTAFEHDADEIFKDETYRWWLGKLYEAHESLELGEDTPGSEKKLRRRIKMLENMMAEWQEDYDYYPESADSPEAEARAARRSVSRLQAIRSGIDRRRAASARHRAGVGGGVVAGTDGGESASSADRVLDGGDGSSQHGD